MGSTAPSSAVLHRDIHQIPNQAISAKGSYILLEDGRKILDATGGAAVSCLGHGNEKVKEAMISQINQMAYCSTAFFSTKPFEDLATFFVASTGRKMTKLYVIGSGMYDDTVESVRSLRRADVCF
jgi:adenosylmethionine-8-amino-7-oxononanoate aminotransferase